MKLLVDLGNSRLKWAVSDGGDWQTGARLHVQRDMGELLDECWPTLERPTQVLMASVAGLTQQNALLAWVAKRWGLAVAMVVAVKEQLGVKNDYVEPASLGSDRWAALIGARRYNTGPLVVVNCGTAVTLDVLSGAGEYLGGAILPGLRLQRDSLLTGTQGVRHADGNPDAFPGRCTADGVAAGTLLGLAGGIERIIEASCRCLQQEPMILLTGGDAPQLMENLRMHTEHVPDLVLRGLACIADDKS